VIKFLDLQKINAQYAGELKQVAAEVIDKGWFLLGERVNAFENEYSAYTDSAHTVACGNGLDALRLIFRAYIELGIMEEGDEVIVPANTYIASILSITDNKLKPILVEPDLDTYNLALGEIEKYITPKTKAILVVHLYGRTCWSKELEAVAEKYHLKVVEDNAQAAGAFYCDGNKAIRTGNLGDAAGHSFYPSKNLGALGDSGAVTTNDAELAAVVRAVANYGSREKYVNQYSGLNSRMDEIQAAFLSVKLKYLDKENDARRKIVDYYREGIVNNQIILPQKPENNLAHIYHLFVIRTKERDRLLSYLTQNDVQIQIHYPIPPHKQKCYKKWNNLSYPITEKIHQEVLSLPISPIITRSDVDQIISLINKWK
jgi:dTDP-4-amino-4,6-dideoxygalactose transaminase